jgi:uncharacterized membrane protein
MGPLTEDHICPHGLVRRISSALSVVGVGVIIGALAPWAVNDRPAAALILASAALGGVLASAVREAVGRKS